MGAPWTPGPWEVGQHPAMTKGWIVRPVLFGSQAKALPECEGGHIVLWNKANAHLIAAAPDLAEALEKLLAEHLDLASRADCLEWAEAEPSPVIAARLALAKARGETE